MIRNTPDLYSTTITGLIDDTAVVGRATFKKALFPISIITFIHYRGRYFYPVTMEYRLIDNNILFLIEELEIRDTEKMKELLMSSMLKEEGWTNEFEILVINAKHPPRHAYELPPDFVIPIVNYSKSL